MEKKPKDHVKPQKVSGASKGHGKVTDSSRINLGFSKCVCQFHLLWVIKGMYASCRLGMGGSFYQLYEIPMMWNGVYGRYDDPNFGQQSSS